MAEEVEDRSRRDGGAPSRAAKGGSLTRVGGREMIPDHRRGTDKNSTPVPHFPLRRKFPVRKTREESIILSP